MRAGGGGGREKGWREDDSLSLSAMALCWRPENSHCSSLLRTTGAIYLENFSSKDTGLPGSSGGWRDAHSLPLSLFAKEELRKTKARGAAGEGWGG